MQSTARQIHEITTNEVRVVSADFILKLDDGELLTGTPTVTAPAASGLTITQPQVNASSRVVNGVTCAAGQAISFKCDATAATAGRYVIDIVCGTDDGQTIQGQTVVLVIEG